MGLQKLCVFFFGTVLIYRKKNTMSSSSITATTSTAARQECTSKMYRTKTKPIRFKGADAAAIALLQQYNGKQVHIDENVFSASKSRTKADPAVESLVFNMQVRHPTTNAEIEQCDVCKRQLRGTVGDMSKLDADVFTGVVLESKMKKNQVIYVEDDASFLLEFRIFCSSHEEHQNVPHFNFFVEIANQTGKPLFRAVFSAHVKLTYNGTRDKDDLKKECVVKLTKVA